jgi:hypothetical protein
MIKLYYHPSPNPAKVALFLEEAGLEYELVPVDTRKGEQHLPAFTSINPNAKTTATRFFSTSPKRRATSCPRTRRLRARRCSRG